jgi:D-alanyl-D-alanine carboxypeptidase/D-alanyl-D-alanine-endopeptidase (penicillin-binding protein 4)
MKKPGRSKCVLIKSTVSLVLGLAALNAEAAKPANNFENVLKQLQKSGTQVSAQIVNLTNTRKILEVGEDRALNPASSIKLFTAYTALKRLGINYQFKTDVYQSKDGAICVKGSGDPSFVMEDMYLLIEALKRKGVDSYSGKITLDATAFDDEYYPEDRSDQNSERAYNSPIAGLNFNYNTISVFVNPTKKGEKARIGLDFPFDFVQVNGKVMTGGSTDVTWSKQGESKSKNDIEVVTLGGKISEDADEWRKPFRLRDPARGWGQAMSKLFATLGVNATGKVSVQEGTCTGTPIYTHTSKPLSFIVQLMDKYSNNFIADSLVKALDHEVNRHPGTAVGGMKFIRDEMKKIGIDSTSKGRSLVAGSGLTLDNRMSASDFITLLKHVHQEKLYLPEMFASLPIAGLDGTLRKKYLRSEVEERLRGKTGTLSGVQSLVGVYPTKDGEWIGIAIITNGGRGIPENELAKYLSTL